MFTRIQYSGQGRVCGAPILPFLFSLPSPLLWLAGLSCGYVCASSKILDLSSTSLDCCCCIYPPRSDRAEVGDLLAAVRTGNAFYLVNLEDSLHSTCVNRRSSVPSLLSPDILDSFLWRSWHFPSLSVPTTSLMDLGHNHNDHLINKSSVVGQIHFSPLS